MWLVVLTAFLAPIGVLASWTAIETRTKEFYFLFLLQQTAMIGVFVSLDLFLYYGFWELSLVPMAILIAMFGRRTRPAGGAQVLRLHVPAFGAVAGGDSVAVCEDGHVRLCATAAVAFERSHLALAPRALFWASLAFLVAFAVKVPVFPLHGWLGDTFSEAPTAMAMVVAGKLGLYSILRFNLGLFPAQSRAGSSVDDCAGGDRHSVWRIALRWYRRI